VNYSRAAARLRRLGCLELPRRSGGSHRKWSNPATGGITVLPDWGPKDLKLGTLRAAVRDLGIDWETWVNA